MIITDPRQQDNPIVFANTAFVNLTGYAREELLGRNCRFLQGPDTNRDDVARVRDACSALTDISVDLLNYRKNGTTFWNALYVSPVVDQAGELQFFFASQYDASDRKETEQKIEAARDHFERISEIRTREFHDAITELKATNAKLQEALETRTALLHEVDHRVKNNLQMVSSLVLLQSRAISDQAVKASLLDMLSRIEALGTVHRRLYQSDDVTRFDVGEFIRDLVSDLVGFAARGRIASVFDLASVTVTAEHAAPIALIVNEVVTNSLKHAFPGGRKGALTVRLGKAEDVMRLEIVDDGVGVDVSGTSGTTFGTSLIRTLARQLKAQISWTNNHPGTSMSLEMKIS